MPRKASIEAQLSSSSQLLAMSPLQATQTITADRRNSQISTIRDKQQEPGLRAALLSNEKIKENYHQLSVVRIRGGNTFDGSYRPFKTKN